MLLLYTDRSHDEHYVDCMYGNMVLSDAATSPVASNEVCVTQCNNTGYLYAATSASPQVGTWLDYSL